MKTNKEMLPKTSFALASARSEPHVLVTLRRQLAYAARILSNDGHDDFNQGQVSARLPRSDSFFIKQALVGFNEANPDDMIEAPVDPDLEHSPKCPPELPLHQAIYRRRPEINAVIHSHAPHGIVVGAKGLAMEAISHEGAPFVDALPRFTETSHTVLHIETADAIVDVLGEHHAILLVNHGSVVVGRTLREATVLACALERACRIQLMSAMLPGSRPSTSTPEDIAKKRKYIFGETSLKAFWDYCVRSVERTMPEVKTWKVS
jgi:L-fuculose-phosphate aldolase